ncbi:MAG TPA: hypothetical protein VE093_25660, partial [Polyangiaceae bacterium]|nr:hypothetical protein [Polyangiaceae bacterium]
MGGDGCAEHAQEGARGFGGAWAELAGLLIQVLQCVEQGPWGRRSEAASGRAEVCEQGSWDASQAREPIQEGIERGGVGGLVFLFGGGDHGVGVGDYGVGVGDYGVGVGDYGVGVGD